MTPLTFARRNSPMRLLYLPGPFACFFTFPGVLTLAALLLTIAVFAVDAIRSARHAGGRR